MDYGMETIKRQTRAAYGCFVADQSPWVMAGTAAWAVRPLCMWHKIAAAAAVCGLCRY